MPIMNNRTVNGLYLFKSLVKSGAVWEGDVVSKKWSEYLAVPVDRREDVEATLSHWTDDSEDDGYKREEADGKLVGVWIA